MPLSSQISPTETAFFYHPRGHDLGFYSGMKFYFNKNSRSFEIDQNPHGEPMLAKIRNIEGNADFTRVAFDTRYRRTPTHFEISCQYDCDRILYRTLAEISETLFAFNEEDRDNVDLTFDKGLLSRLSLHKHVDTKLVDFLNIVREADALYLIKQRPWARVRLEGHVVVSGREISARAGSEEITYHLDIQGFIGDIVARLVNGSQS